MLIIRALCTNRLPLTWTLQVSIANQKLAGPDCYQFKMNHFGIGKPTMGATKHELCSAIKKKRKEMLVACLILRQATPFCLPKDYPSLLITKRFLMTHYT